MPKWRTLLWVSAVIAVVGACAGPEEPSSLAGDVTPAATLFGLLSNAT
jgi:hypothetical protein